MTPANKTFLRGFARLSVEGGGTGFSLLLMRPIANGAECHLRLAFDAAQCTRQAEGISVPVCKKLLYVRVASRHFTGKHRFRHGKSRSIRGNGVSVTTYRVARFQPPPRALKRPTAATRWARRTSEYWSRAA